MADASDIKKKKPRIDPTSPNKRIDRVIVAMMERIKDEKTPLETCVKVLGTAINWERVKYQIKEEAGGFDPDKL